MVTFFVAFVILLFGYFIYAKVVEKYFVVNPNFVTPVHTKADGVDYVPLSDRKATLIQFISIAGTGPIFGAILGAMWGPAAFFWIVLGCVFAGATHDYVSGMLSLRQGGATLAEMVGSELGNTIKTVCRVVMVFLLMMVAAVFTMSPADILVTISPNALVEALPAGGARWFWIVLIVGYFGVATVIPINKLIAKLYPVFGVGMILLGAGMAVMLFVTGAISRVPEFSFVNPHPAGRSLWPYLFITIACGAISGFHATQSPLMARCMANETGGRNVFYRAMIFEGFLALIWAAVAMTFFYNPAAGISALEGLGMAGPPAVVVSVISFAYFGVIGGVIAVICIGIFPISTGDTALRVCRLAIADAFKMDQGPILNRFKVSIPLFIVLVSLLFIDFGILWRYFAWLNQTLAVFTLWTGAVYLAKRRSNHWICTIPAVFMTFLTQSYIMVATEGLRLPHAIGMPIGGLITIACIVAFARKCKSLSDNPLS
ncbi:MAG: carbon starvation protein A [Spirochaetes bacterium]|nr:carbon starvation protein A [Spirochaetota bacterium]